MRSLRAAALLSATASSLLITGGVARAAYGSPGGSAPPPDGRALLVCNGSAPGGCPATGTATVYRTIQSAVNASRNGDWILVWPGLYPEDVTVDRRHGLSNGLHIRGMDRNGVLLDGSYGRSSDHGVYVIGVDNTWVENMSAQNYQYHSGNAFWWAGVKGYWGNHLTAYNNANYGTYAYNSTNPSYALGSFVYDYASWNGDSGVYIGDCTVCNAVITNGHFEHNAIGYSGTNAGGNLTVENSEWDHNLSGIVPNTLLSEPNYPQRGVIIQGNYVHDNNDGNAPGSGITALAPLGVGIELAGGSENIVQNNLVTNEKHNGVLIHWLMTPAMDNKVLDNSFDHVGYGKTPGDADIGVEAGSPQNCFSGNVDTTGGKPRAATTDPPGIAWLNDCRGGPGGNPTVGNCPGPGACLPAIYQPGDPILSVGTALNAAGVSERRSYGGPGPHPEAQQGMSNPCDGAPDSAWCSGGRIAPGLAIPSSPGRVPAPIKPPSSGSLPVAAAHAGTGTRQAATIRRPPLDVSEWRSRWIRSL